MKKVIDRKKHISSSGLTRNTIELFLECGHTVVKSGAAIHEAKYQKIAKCKTCEK